MKRETIIIALITPLFTIIGIVIGNYLSHQSAQELYLLQRRSELKERTYSRLMGLKLPLTQALRTHLEAKMLSEFYDARYIRLSHRSEDRVESKRQYQRALDLVPKIADLLREVFESLGEVRIAYDLTPEIETQVNAIYTFSAADISPPGQDEIRSEVDLERWKNKINTQIVQYLDDQYTTKFNSLLPELLKQLKTTRD